MVGRRARLWAPIVIVVLVVAGGAAFLLLRDSDGEPGWTSAAGRVFDPGTCADTTPAADFGFSRLPPIREPDLGFAGFRRVRVPGEGSGPVPRVRIEGWDGRLVSSGQYYRVVVYDETRGRATRGWQVEARMLALDGEGAVIEEISHDKVEMNQRSRMPQLRMRIGDQPGFYRLDLRVDRPGGRPQRYGQYLKVESPRGEGRLAVGGHRFRPGENVEMRVENLGTEKISYGVDAWLQRNVGGLWMPVPEERAWNLQAMGSAGGEAGTCLGYQLDPQLPPGRYRLVKQVETRAERRGYNEHVLVSAPFEIVD